MEIFKVFVLFLSSLALIYACTTRLIRPLKAVFLQSYLATSQNKLAITVDLLNEIRGMGSVLFIGAIVVFVGILLPDFQLTSFVVATLILFGIVLGRLLSSFVDGKPSQRLIQVATVEAALSILNIICLINILS